MFSRLQPAALGASFVVAATLFSGLPACAQETASAPGRTLANPAPGALRGSKVIGLPVIGMDHVRVGSIEDLLVGSDGRVSAVVIGVGGFLGLGEKLVAVPYDQVSWNLKDVPLTSGPTSVTTPKTAPSQAEAAKVTPETMPGADTSRDVLGAVEDKHTGKVGAETGSTAGATVPKAEPATVLAGGTPLHVEVRMTKAQLTAAPAFSYDAARKAEK